MSPMLKKVVVETHNPKWSEMFHVEADNVARALGPNVETVYHIGSTAIPGIYAKPIIDLLVGVTDIDRVDANTPAMESLGYEALGEHGLPGRRYFRKDNHSGVRTHHVHTFAANHADIERHLAFRDFMREHPEWAVQYSDLKRKLAEQFVHDIEGYMDGKDAFIKDIDRRATVWRAERREPDASA